MESEKEVGSAALVQLLIWFSISRTCQRALLSSLTVDWLPRNVFLSLSLFLTLCAQSWPALEFYCHIFLHTAWRNVPKSAANISFIFALNQQQQQKPVQREQHMAFHADDDKWAKCTQKYQNIWYI